MFYHATEARDAIPATTRDDQARYAPPRCFSLRIVNYVGAFCYGSDPRVADIVKVQRKAGIQTLSKQGLRFYGKNAKPFYVEFLR